MLAPDRLPVAKDYLQHLQQPGRLLGSSDTILHMLGKVAKDLPQVPHKVGHRVTLVAGLDHAPVDAHLIQGIDQAGSPPPVVRRGDPAFSRLRVEDKHRLAIGDQGTLSGVHRQIPARPARSQHKLLGRQAKRFLYQGTGQAGDVGILIHLRPGLVEDPPALGRIDPYAGVGQHVQRALVNLRSLILRKHLQDCSHRLLLRSDLAISTAQGPRSGRLVRSVPVQPRRRPGSGSER